MYKKIMNLLELIKFYFKSEQTISYKLKPKTTYYLDSEKNQYIKIKTLANSNIIEYKRVRICWDAVYLQAQNSDKLIGDIVIDLVESYKND